MAPLTTAPQALAAVMANARKQPTPDGSDRNQPKIQSSRIRNPCGDDREPEIREAVKMMEELGLDLKSPKVILTRSDKHSNSVGTYAGQTSTIVHYEQFWRHLLDFCIAIATCDYESASILCRRNLWSEGRDKLRVLEEGTVLTHHATDLPLTSLDHSGPPDPVYG